jgi:hypothetical protein
MKTIPFLLLAAGLLSAGCKKDDSASTGKTNASSSGNPMTAPVDYVGTVVKAKGSATKTIMGAGLDRAITLFYTETGRFPKDLKELTPQYLPNIPPPPAGMKYDYDPKTGTAKVVPE